MPSLLLQGVMGALMYGLPHPLGLLLPDSSVYPSMHYMCYCLQCSVMGKTVGYPGHKCLILVLENWMNY